MAASGGIRADIDADQNVVIGEDRTINVDVNQSDGSTAQTMTGWALAWYLSERPGSTILVTKTTGGSGITITNGDGTDDRAAITLTDTDTESGSLADKATLTYHHELWRTDAGNESRLAYGKFVLHQGAVTT